jgi:hypothetical protein
LWLDLRERRKFSGAPTEKNTFPRDKLRQRQLGSPLCAANLPKFAGYVRLLAAWRL